MAPTAFQASLAANRKRNLVIGGAVLAALVIGIVGLRAAGLLKVGGSSEGSDLRAGGTGNVAMLKEAGADQGAMLQATNSTVAMPADVDAWLKHLKEVEDRKRALTASQAKELQIFLGQANATDGMMTGDTVKEMADPDSNIQAPALVTDMQKMVDRQKQQWYDLSDFLRSVPAPEECKKIEVAYDQGLTQMGMTMSDIAGIPQKAVDDAESDPNGARDRNTAAANEINTNHTQVIDKSFETADKGVADICAKYKVAKMFDIDTSGKGSGMMTSIGG